MRFLLSIAALSILLFFSCTGKQGKEQDKYNVFNKTYEVGVIPGIQDFEKYNAMETRLDSIYQDPSDQLTSSQSFRHQRSRVFIATINSDSSFSKYDTISMPCDCEISNDTIRVQMVIGFFGGLGFTIELFSDQFLSHYTEYTDGVKPYKVSLDSSFSNSAIVPSKYQFLILDQKPTFKPGQQLTGFLAFTSNNYYERNVGQDLDTAYVTGKLYFTCKTRQLATLPK